VPHGGADYVSVSNSPWGFDMENSNFFGQIPHSRASSAPCKAKFCVKTPTIAPLKPDGGRYGAMH